MSIIQDKLKLNLSKFVNDEFDTLAGYIVNIAGRVPINGEVIRDVQSGLEFEILSADKRKLINVKIKGIKALNA